MTVPQQMCSISASCRRSYTTGTAGYAYINPVYGIVGISFWTQALPTSMLCANCPLVEAIMQGVHDETAYMHTMLVC